MIIPTVPCKRSTISTSILTRSCRNIMAAAGTVLTSERYTTQLWFATMAPVAPALRNATPRPNTKPGATYPAPCSTGTAWKLKSAPSAGMQNGVDVIVCEEQGVNSLHLVLCKHAELHVAKCLAAVDKNTSHATTVTAAAAMR
ncbi:hypothetical protein TcCL_ESM03313 [Trypanosoma cruzi]|nr:hypothetical protein TcCL_ESM03313 [Trypanosoma cruzi]